MVTIKDVARRAGVAISTVSYTLNGSKHVSDVVAERVMKAVEESGYAPHAAARSLRSGNSRMVGLLVPDVVNPYFAAVARAVESVCSEAGYLSVVFSTGHDRAKEAQILKVVRQQRMAGLIMAPTGCDQGHGEFLSTEIDVPTVMLDMGVAGTSFSVVKMDHVAVGALATNHLIALGHRRIAIVKGLPGLITSDDRVEGYRAALLDAGIALDPALELRGDFNRDIAEQSMAAALNLPDRPTAVVSLSNMMTVGTMLALKRHRVAIPRDMALVGVGDLELAELLETPPTVVVGPREQIAMDAVHLLLNEIERGSSSDRSVTQNYQPRLIIRSSCGKARPPAL